MNKILKRELAAYSKQRKPLVNTRKSSKKVQASPGIKSIRSRKDRETTSSQDNQGENTPRRHGVSGLSSVQDFAK